MDFKTKKMKAETKEKPKGDALQLVLNLTEQEDLVQNALGFSPSLFFSPQDVAKCARYFTFMRVKR
jgi:hypothetical protein